MVIVGLLFIVAAGWFGLVMAVDIYAAMSAGDPSSAWLPGLGLLAVIGVFIWLAREARRDNGRAVVRSRNLDTLRDLNCTGIYRVKGAEADVTLQFVKTRDRPYGSRGRVRLINESPAITGPFGGVAPARGGWRIENSNPNDPHIFIDLSGPKPVSASGIGLMLGPYYSGECDKNEALVRLVQDSGKDTETIFKLIHEPGGRLNIADEALEAWLKHAETPRTDGLYRGTVAEWWWDSDSEKHTGDDVYLAVLFEVDAGGNAGTLKGINRQVRIASETPGRIAFKGTWRRGEDGCLSVQIVPMSRFAIRGFDPGDVKYGGHFIGEDDILSSGQMRLETFEDWVTFSAMDEDGTLGLQFDGESEPSQLLKNEPDEIKEWLA